MIMKDPRPPSERSRRDASTLCGYFSVGPLLNMFHSTTPQKMRIQKKTLSPSSDSSYALLACSPTIWGFLQQGEHRFGHTNNSKEIHLHYTTPDAHLGPIKVPTISYACYVRSKRMNLLIATFSHSTWNLPALLTTPHTSHPLDDAYSAVVAASDAMSSSFITSHFVATATFNNEIINTLLRLHH